MTTTETAPIEETTILDAKGLKCPMPVVRTAQAIKTLTSGQLLEVLATDPGAVADFAAWSRSTGHALVSSSIDGGVYRFIIRRK
jgi:tRNA 2-thiouridine synthesizing protein A